MINESKIICYDCKKSKSNTYNNEFYKYLTCGKILCPLCNIAQTNKNKSHKIIDIISTIIYVTYIMIYIFSIVSNAKKNICMSYEIEHNNAHTIIYYSNIILSKEKIKDEITKFGKKIEKLKNIIRKLLLILQHKF